MRTLGPGLLDDGILAEHAKKRDKEDQSKLTGGGISDNKNRTPKPKGDPKPKDDLSALFSDKETEEVFQEWRLSSADLIPLSKFEKMPDVLQWLFYAKAEFWLDRYSKGWDDANEVLAEQREIFKKIKDAIPEAEKYGRLAATFENWDAIQAKQKRLLTLDTKARPAAIEKRRKTAELNNEALNKAISDLLETHPHARSWTNEDIADWIAQKYLVYKRSTILQRVKKIAAEIRKKDRQNRQLPNR